MKDLYCLLLASLLFCAPALAQRDRQTVQFRSGTLHGEPNIQRQRSGEWQQQVRYRDHQYVLLRFSTLPNARQRQELAQQGVQLFDYIPGNAFYAELPDQLAFRSLEKYAVDGVFNTRPALKLSKALQEPASPGITGPGQYFAVHYFGSLPAAEIISALLAAGARLSDQSIKLEKAILIQADTSVLQRIAALPFVSYVHEQTIRDQPLNNRNRQAYGAAALGMTTGRNLQGRGVTIGIGDQGEPNHLDIASRLINRNPNTPDFHGLHTGGTVSGAGHLNPLYKGMAPRSTLVSNYFSNILINTPLYVSEYGMVLTNNSYESSSAGCIGTGVYDALSNYVDAQLYNDEELLHVFASGNSGNSTCYTYPASFHTVRSGFQSSKNALIVGNINSMDDVIAANSSCGPVDDGRIKPELVAGGVNVWSTSFGNTYANNSGTSMSAPTVTGTLALLVERYRQLHGGANPPAALIKAAACNSAEDMGNPGPDYTFGFGRLNAVSAVETLEENRYFLGSVGPGPGITHTIPAGPPGASRLKVMLYWTDAPANPGAALALVNNLDLTVTGTDAFQHRPLILNPDPAFVDADAAEGVDNLNNIEQVVINNLPAGPFTVRVTGSAVPSGAQQYVVVYQWLQPSVRLGYPLGAETLVPGETEYIRWEAYNAGNSGFTLEYSADNGGSWNTISNTVPAADRRLAWTVPNIISTEVLVRVTSNSAGYTDQSSQRFTILDTNRVTMTRPCPGFVQLNWSAVDGASSYDVLQLINDSMVVIANVTGTSYLVSGLLKNGTGYWFACRPLIGTAPGRQSSAIIAIPNTGNCNTAAFRYDLAPELLLAPVTGRTYTRNEPGLVKPKVRISNAGPSAINTAFTVSYQVNNGSVVTETANLPIAIRSNADYTFLQPYDFSAPGDYSIRCWVDLDLDPFPANDTLLVLVKHLENEPVLLNPSVVEGFETVQDSSYSRLIQGFPGLDRMDFNASNNNGRARFFVNNGFARSGQQALILDQRTKSTTINADSATVTFNFSNYSDSDQLWLDLYYRNHGINFVAPGNAVWVRGNDTASWINVFNMPIEPENFGIYRMVKAINISQALATANPAQSVSSSFQLCFGQQGYTSAASVMPLDSLEDGISYDDVIITRAVNDVSVSAILSPATTGVCSLGNNEAITLELNNYSSSTLNNVAVSYKLNGTVVTETISLSPGTAIPFTFSGRVNLSAFRQYNLQAWVHYPTDNYRNNDTVPEIVFHTTPLVSSFPYLEGFEQDNGHWYTMGKASSWVRGKPEKSIINKAANGDNAWTTGLLGGYNDNEQSYLYSPCFNLSGLSHPVLSFSHIFQLEDNCDCDYHWVEYSTDDVTWTSLGLVGQGTNWYNYAPARWRLSKPNWHVASIAIPVTAPRVRFRFVMSSDIGGTREGVGIDDIHVFDQTVIYTGSEIAAGLLTNTVNGNSWQHFDMAGQRLLSIQPQGQDLGTVEVQAYFNTDPVRVHHNQYYLDRNLVVKASTPPTGNVRVRYYFTEAEMNRLLNASGCMPCNKPADAYETGVTQYSGINENSTLDDNASTGYRFLLPRTNVQIIPFFNGYYAEFTVNRFSEFWINGGGPDVPLPVTLSSFTATRNGGSTLLQWSTAQESNSQLFIIEKSLDGQLFTAIGTLPAAGNSNQPLEYQFTDPQLRPGTSYYRLNMVDLDGSHRFSPVRTIQMEDDPFLLRYYPNPVVNGRLTLETGADAYRVELTDMQGRLLMTLPVRGRTQQLSLPAISKGAYLLTAYTTAGKKTVKIVVGKER
ncbi:MAG: S8 family serine peptidase [Candidatus Pseudobacter hemicellulosilyticus]|uniref:S8 family serine peptidase n=1 Tax=Candidatus Pseudobacter hemicellulosilyticus TaxID=3121375 RepID=A0AAJ5WSN1_9BACT|nr:MAG: S8 family serine peptidase [Pseudobacter sp.]